MSSLHSSYQTSLFSSLPWLLAFSPVEPASSATGCVHSTGDFMTELAFHAIADIFPLMDGQPLADLTEDIRQHGLREPIWLYEGKILDGRNRYRACQAAGVEPVFADYQDDEPVRFVVSLNLHRRHLNESQRSWVGKNIATMTVGNSSGNNQHKRNSANLQNSNSKEKTVSESAELMNVSERSIYQARQVDRDGISELGKKVASGQVRVSTAADIATLPPGQQDVIVDIIISAVTTSLSTSSFRQSRHRRRHHHFGRASTSSRKIWPWQGSGSHQQTRFLPFSSGRLAISSGSANRSALYRRNASVLV